MPNIFSFMSFAYFIQWTFTRNLKLHILQAFIFISGAWKQSEAVKREAMQNPQCCHMAILSCGMKEAVSHFTLHETVTVVRRLKPEILAFIVSRLCTIKMKKVKKAGSYCLCQTEINMKLPQSTVKITKWPLFIAEFLLVALLVGQGLPVQNVVQCWDGIVMGNNVRTSTVRQNEGKMPGVCLGSFSHTYLLKYLINFLYSKQQNWYVPIVF